MMRKRKNLVNNKAGRPPALTLSADLIKTVSGLARIGSTHREVAAVLGCAYQTWMTFKSENQDAQDAYDRGFEQGKASLRRTQYKLAERNAAMAIWLGKQYLGQKDRREFTGPDGGPIQTLDLAGLNDEQLEQLERTLAILADAGSGEAGEGSSSADQEG